MSDTGSPISQSPRPDILAAGEPNTPSTCQPQGLPATGAARLNAERLSLAARWRHALQAPGTPASREFWEAEEMSEVWAHAEHDEALLAMLHEDEDAALGLSTPSEALDEAELARAQDRFVHRMQQAQPEPAPRPQVLASTGNTSALTVSEVVEAMEREAQRSGAQPPEAASWRRVLEPVRSSREALPSHITAKAMSDFWSRVGLAVPRDVAAAFSHAARLLLMGRAAPQGRLSLARSARPAGISHEVERLAAQASNADAPDTQAAESARPNTDSTPPREDAST